MRHLLLYLVGVKKLEPRGHVCSASEHESLPVILIPVGQDSPEIAMAAKIAMAATRVFPMLTVGAQHRRATMDLPVTIRLHRLEQRRPLTLSCDSLRTMILCDL